MTLEHWIGSAVCQASAPEEKNFSGQHFPYVLSPVNTLSKSEFMTFVKENKGKLVELMHQHGAIAFRGFGIDMPVDFQEFLDCLDMEELPYVGGAAPRKVIVGNVVTTNEAPPEAKIPFHHEMAQVPLYPSKIFFYCEVAALEGGQTPICPSNEVYERLKNKHLGFIEKLETHGVIYTRVLPCEDDASSPIGRGWKSTFQTTDRKIAEIKAKDLGVNLEWLPNGDVKSVSGILKGVKNYRGKPQFFNSIVAAYTGWIDSRNNPSEAVTFGNGDKFDPQVIDDCSEIMDEVCCNWKWQRGDVLMIDNNQTMHARRSFVPPRRIMAAIYK